jgi:hypothetical protein
MARDGVAGNCLTCDGVAENSVLCYGVKGGRGTKGRTMRASYTGGIGASVHLH